MTKFDPVESGLGYYFGFLGSAHLLPGFLAGGNELLLLLFLGIALVICGSIYKLIGCLNNWKGKLLLIAPIFTGLLIYFFDGETISEIERFAIFILAIVIYVLVYLVFVHVKLKLHLNSTGGTLWK